MNISQKEYRNLFAKDTLVRLQFTEKESSTAMVQVFGIIENADWSSESIHLLKLRIFDELWNDLKLMANIKQFLIKVCYLYDLK